MPVTAMHAAILAGLYIFLSARVIGTRRSGGVEIGDGENRELLRRMRVHANFAEYVPFALVLMALAESLALPALALHGIGTLLVAGRIAHAYGLSQTPHILKLRVLGMAATFAAIGLSAAGCIVLSVLRGGA